MHPIEDGRDSGRLRCRQRARRRLASARADEVTLDVHEWKIIERESGDVNYYRVIDLPDLPYIHSAYQPGMDTAVMGHAVPEGVKGLQKLRWTWRAMALPPRWMAGSMDR